MGGRVFEGDADPATTSRVGNNSDCLGPYPVQGSIFPAKRSGPGARHKQGLLLGKSVLGCVVHCVGGVWPWFRTRACVCLQNGGPVKLDRFDSLFVKTRMESGERPCPEAVEAENGGTQISNSACPFLRIHFLGVFF